MSEPRWARGASGEIELPVPWTVRPDDERIVLAELAAYELSVGFRAVLFSDENGQRAGEELIRRGLRLTILLLMPPSPPPL